MRSWIVLVVVTALMAALPLVGNNYLLRLATITSMYAVLAQSWNFIGGLAGYPSFATAAFFGLGAYVSAILQVHGLPAGAAWGCAGLIAMLFAALIGGAILHLPGTISRLRPWLWRKCCAKSSTRRPTSPVVGWG